MANRVYGYQGYKGYQFETSPKKLQPEYEPNKQKSIETKTKNKVNRVRQPVKQVEEKKHRITKTEAKRKATFIAYIIFGFSVLFTISYRNSIISERFTEKENLKTQLSEIQKVNEQLEVSLENELNLTSIEKMAKEQLGMNKLNNGQKVYVNLSKKEYVESKTEGIVINNNESAFQKACNVIKEFFSK